MLLAMRRLVKLDGSFALLKFTPVIVPGYTENTIFHMVPNHDLF
jgi:hypothetical protein